jgi:hypothetical protein
MTDATNDTFVIESNEGKRARKIKSQVLNMMEEVVDLMEEARKEGFEVQFSVQKNADGANFINNDLLKVIKVW